MPRVVGGGCKRGNLPLSPCGRGRGPPRSGGKVRGTDEFKYTQANPFRILEHFGVPKPRHAKPLPFKIPGAALVTVDLIGVLTAIELDDETV